MFMSGSPLAPRCLCAFSSFLRMASARREERFRLGRDFLKRVTTRKLIGNTTRFAITPTYIWETETSKLFKYIYISILYRMFVFKVEMLKYNSQALQMSSDFLNVQYTLPYITDAVNIYCSFHASCHDIVSPNTCSGVRAKGPNSKAICPVPLANTS